MNVATNANPSAFARTTNPSQSLAALLNASAVELRKVAPKYVNVSRLMSLAIEATQRNQLLANCSPISVVNFCKKCAEAGTDRIGAGGMWAVPFWNNKANCYDMVPIPDWRLLIEKAKKAQAIKHATAEAVYENDQFDYERGMEPKLVHRPALANRGKIRAVYCVYTLPDGTRDFVVMDWAADVVPIRDRTNAWRSWLEKKFENPWVTAEAEQGKKTVVKRAMKLFEGASPELTRLIEVDNVVNGFAEVDTVPPIPIAEPRALPPADDVPIGKEPEPTAASVDGETVTGILEAVSEKDGENSRGKYVKFGLKVGGEFYGTFDAAIGTTAKALKGHEVVLTWERDGKFKNAKAVHAAQAASGAAGPTDGGDELSQALMAYEDGFPKMFAKGCEHVGIASDDWKTAPAEALARLRKWLDAESSR